MKCRVDVKHIACLSVASLGAIVELRYTRPLSRAMALLAELPSKDHDHDDNDNDNKYLVLNTTRYTLRR